MANESVETGTNVNTETTVETESNKQNTADLEARIKQLEAENGKLRQANTNASADASKWKKQYQERLSEEERNKEQQAEQAATLQSELEALRAERNVANYKSQLLSIGFEDGLATNVATALNGGEVDKIFDGIRRFVAAHDKAMRETAFRTNPTLSGGEGSRTVTKEQFAQMGYKERLELYNTQPDLYKELTK